MAIKLSPAVFDAYNQIVRDILEKRCTVIYPEKKEECPNCYLNTMSSKSMSISVYKVGGPVPFSDGMPCPYCNGSGYKAVETTEIIPMRIYWEKKHWYKVPGLEINIPDGAIQTIFNMSYLPKIQICKYLVPANNTIEKHINAKYQKSGDAYPLGFEQNSVKYAVMFWILVQ